MGGKTLFFFFRNWMERDWKRFRKKGGFVLIGRKREEKRKRKNWIWGPRIADCGISKVLLIPPFPLCFFFGWVVVVMIMPYNS